MANALGHSFADVRVHDGVEGDEVARAHDARALTVGSDLFFRAGEYAPESAAGAHVLAHELVHVVQQRSPAGAFSDATAEYQTTATPNEARPDSAALEVGEQGEMMRVAEREAHAGAAAVSGGEQASIAPSTVVAGTAQRWPWDDEGGGGTLGTLGGLGGFGGLGSALGGGGLRANTDNLGALPGQLLGAGKGIMSSILPSPGGVAKQVGQTVRRVQSGVESVIDPVVSGIGRAAEWGGGKLEGILGMGEGIGEGIAGGLGGAPMLRLPDESDLE